MRKTILLYFIVLVIVGPACSQDLKKIEEDFTSEIKNGKIPYGNNPAAGKFYDVRGFKMYCEVYGAGKPLLMIHGNGGSINVFAQNIPYFSKKYQVIIPDARAHGKSK